MIININDIRLDRINEQVKTKNNNSLMKIITKYKFELFIVQNDF